METESKNVLQRGLESIHEPFSYFIRAQTTSSLILLMATAAALWWANSIYSASYIGLIHTPIGFFVGDFELRASLKHIINDGLMVIFFFLLGLEIKREVLAGDLAKPENRRMLMVCAIGGMICPALIYSIFNWSLNSQIGWGIPMATDTAFALGVLTIVRKYIPVSLLAFIVGLAIVDDVGAILVIAVFYTQEISLLHLTSAIGCIGILAAGNYAGIRQSYFYILIGITAWWAMLQSGVHPTVAGVAIALTIPARPKLVSKKIVDNAKYLLGSLKNKSKEVDMLGNKKDHEQVKEVRDFTERASAPLRRWEDTLDLPVALIILPLFALTNAGVIFDTNSLVKDLQDPVGIGIIAGLVLGKFIGISGGCWLALKLNIGRLPKNVNLKHVVSASLIAGIGFTMSTFIAALGFDSQPEHLHVAKTSILIASVLSAVLGVIYIRITATNPSQTNT
ncbi:Na+/H+ antiporter NhaA [Colwellia sp. RE-S-Sl-9]